MAKGTSQEFPVSDLPRTLAELLGAPSHSSDDAWEAFVANYSRLFLSVARSVSSGSDQTMDAYAHILEQLHAEEFRRLRGYATDPRSKFTTWLVVVTRRACVDFHRSRFGRARGNDSNRSRERRSLRRELHLLMTASDDLSLVVDETAAAADAQLLSDELNEGLKCALDKLQPSDRLMLALKYEEELSASEIAKIMILPSPFHVYRRLDTILADLRRTLRSRGIVSATQ